MRRDSPFFSVSLAALGQSPLFKGLDRRVLAELLEFLDRQTYKRRALLPSRLSLERFSVITSGQLEIIRTDPEGTRRITVALLGPGDGFDVLTLLDEQEHGSEHVALTNLQLLTAPVDRFRRWIWAHPEFNRTLLPYLGKKMRALEALTADIALADTASRLGRFILDHADPTIETSPAGVPVALVHDLSQEVMARMIGSVRAVVSRHLQEWKELGILKTGRNRLQIEDLRALRARCDRLSAAGAGRETSDSRRMNPSET